MLHYCLVHGECVCLTADLPKQTKLSNKEQSKNICVCVCETHISALFCCKSTTRSTGFTVNNEMIINREMGEWVESEW